MKPEPESWWERGVSRIQMAILLALILAALAYTNARISKIDKEHTEIISALTEINTNVQVLTRELVAQDEKDKKPK